MKNYLLVGLAGVGKSSFINTAFGIQAAKIDHYVACTKVVEHYPRNTPYGEVCLIDSPGLAEHTGEHDNTYLGLVRERIQNTPLEAMIYISRLDETRFRPEEQGALERLTTHLGARIWGSSWLVLTFAASVPDHRREEAASERSGQIARFLHQLTARSGPAFNSFRTTLLVDNVVAKWSPRCQPLLNFFR